MWGMSFVFVSNKSEWLTDSTTHTNLKIVVGSCLGAYIYNKTPSCPLPRFARIYFCTTPPPPSRIISHRYAPARETSRWKHFCFFVVLINFQLSVKHFSVLPCYFMKREDIWKNAEFCNQLWISGVTQVTLHQLSSKWLEILMQS